MAIDYTKFKNSLKRLEEQNENYQSMDTSLPDLMKEAISESVIQRFETCFDSTWKVLKRYLSEELGLLDIPNSPKPILRSANDNELLSSDIEQWFDYLDARNGTAHDYSEDKANVSLEMANLFVDDAIGIYQTLSGETWE